MERHSSGGGLDANTLAALIAETDEVLAYADLLYNWDSKGELQTPKFEASTRAADAVEFLVLRGTDKQGSPESLPIRLRFHKSALWEARFLAVLRAALTFLFDRANHLLQKPSTAEQWASKKSELHAIDAALKHDPEFDRLLKAWITAQTHKFNDLLARIKGQRDRYWEKMAGWGDAEEVLRDVAEQGVDLRHWEMQMYGLILNS